jgi:NAD(P)-dependent dehydrogenase (short-subunit alcohol dehydrogenase family)
MQGKVGLITGATSGIGRVAALELARRGAQVVIVGRDPAKCDQTLAMIRQQAKDSQVEALQADLSSLDQVRSLANQFRQRHSRLDVLINNAGGLFLHRQLTVDGLERTFALNHVSYFLLTLSLLDLLQASAPARIINVASRAHKGATLDFTDLMGEKSYAGWQAYRRSKLANLLFTYELARRLNPGQVTVNALHPGWVATGFAGNNGWAGRLIQGAANLFALTPEQGARTIVYLATAKELAGQTGGYYVQEKLAASSPASMDKEAAQDLWQKSLQLCGLPALVTASC